jgi:hypothetical protein
MKRVSGDIIQGGNGESEAERRKGLEVMLNDPQSMSDEELQTLFSKRLRRHMMTLPMMMLTMGGPILFLAIATPLIYHGATPHSVRKIAGAIMGLGTGGAILYGLVSTFVNLRCPSCNAFVGYLVSYNSSIFGIANPKKNCQKCHRQIFRDQTSRRTLRILIILFVLGLVFGGAMVASTMLQRPHRHHRTPSSIPSLYWYLVGCQPSGTMLC